MPQLCSIGIDQRRERRPGIRSRDRAGCAIRAGNRSRAGSRWRRSIHLTAICARSRRSAADDGGASPSRVICVSRNSVSTWICPAATSAANGAPSSPRADKLVVRAAAKRLRGIVSAQEPDRPRAGGFSGKPRKVDQRSDRRMSRAQNGNGLSRIPRAVLSEHVGHAVCDVCSIVAFADGGEAVGAGRIWRKPRARRVDHGSARDAFGTRAVLVAEFERSGFAAFGLELVETEPADIRDTA